MASIFDTNRLWRTMVSKWNLKTALEAQMIGIDLLLKFDIGYSLNSEISYLQSGSLEKTGEKKRNRQ